MAAENAVRSFKNKFKLLLKSGMSRHEALCKFSFYYRATPHCTANCSPAELQIGQKFRTKLDLLYPMLRHSVERKQESQKQFYRGNRRTMIEIDEIVMAKDYSSNAWRTSRVRDRLSQVSYEVVTDDDSVWKRYVDQLRPYNLEMREYDYSVLKTAVNSAAESHESEFETAPVVSVGSERVTQPSVSEFASVVSVSRTTSREYVAQQGL